MKIVIDVCHVCGEQKNTETHCTTYSYAYDNDDYRYTEEVCWNVCENCRQIMMEKENVN